MSIMSTLDDDTKYGLHFFNGKAIENVLVRI